MRADRLLSILLLLQVHQRLTARELAKRLEVSERTIHRDMEALSISGVPVIAERGQGGGWGLLEEYRTNLTGLTETEIQTLFLIRPESLLADLGLSQTSEAALIKLLAALPTVQRRDAEYARQRMYVDAAGWNNTQEAVPHLHILQEAIWQERKLRFDYKRNEATFERIVDPLGLVAKAHIWYLVAAVEGQVRSYRVSRIQSAEILEDQVCVRPPDFDLADYWTHSSREFRATIPRHTVLIRARREARSGLLHAGRFIEFEELEPCELDTSDDTDEWITAKIHFQAESEMCGYLLSFGTAIEILEPQALREQVIKLAESVANFYTQKV